MSLLGGLGPTIIAVMWIETVIALIFVCLRLWTRFRINHAVGWDDYLISFSWVRSSLSLSLEAHLRKTNFPPCWNIVGFIN